MADLNELQAAQTVKIAGSSGAGTESNFVNADSNNNMNVAVYGGTDNTKIGNNLDSFKVVELVSHKLTPDIKVGNIQITAAAYVTVYSYSGSGLLFGFQVAFDNAAAQFKLTLDSDVIFDVNLNVLKTFDLSPSGPLTTGLGGLMFSINGNVVNFIPPHPLAYSSLVKLEAKSSNATNHNYQQSLFVMTKET